MLASETFGVTKIFCLSGSFHVGTLTACSLGSDESQATAPKDIMSQKLLSGLLSWNTMGCAGELWILSGSGVPFRLLSGYF